MLAEELNIEEKQALMDRLKEAFQEMTTRQLECFLLMLCGFTQEETGCILGIDQKTVSKHLGNFWDIFGNNG